MDATGSARLAAVLKTRPDPPVVGLDQTPRIFRLGVVTVSSPLTIMFNNDAAATVAGLPVLNGYTGIVGAMVVVAVFDGGGMVVLGPVTPTSGGLPWAGPWGYQYTVSPWNSNVDQTGITAATVLNSTVVAINVGANRRLRLDAHLGATQVVSGGNQRFFFQKDGVTIGHFGFLDGAPVGLRSVDGVMFDLTTAGVHTYQLLGSTSAGTLTIANATHIASFTITDVGPGGPPL